MTARILTDAALAELIERTAKRAADEAAGRFAEEIATLRARLPKRRRVERVEEPVAKVAPEVRDAIRARLSRPRKRRAA